MTSSTKENFEDSTIIWLDLNRIHENNDDYLDTKTRLRECNNYIEVYDDKNKCIDGIKTNEHVFLIVSGSIYETFIPTIFQIEQIIFIYVLCLNDEPNDASKLKDISKFHGIFSSKTQLIEKVKQDIKSFSKSLIPIDVINEQSIRALDKEYSIFMWTQLLIDVLIQIPQTDKGKHMMLNDCRLYYAGNNKYLKEIERFENEYEPDRAIWWYTCESFVYKQLNKALRTQNIDSIFKYRFFITDVCAQLKELYNKNISSFEEPCTIYRGQNISCHELIKMKNNINGLISMNTFLSTTKNKNLALIYAGNGSDRPSSESILFEIKLDKNIAAKSKPFADITALSQFGEEEEEILLSIGIIFKIQSIEELNIDNGLVWEIKLLLNESVVNKEIQMLFDYMKMDSTTNISNISTLGILLSQMGDYERARQYYQMMLDELPFDHVGVPIILNNIGNVYSNSGNTERALEYYKESYTNYKLQNLSEDSLLLANLYQNMGSTYYESKHNQTALKYFKKALKICNMNSSVASLLLVAALYIAMSGIFDDDEDFDNALLHLQHALNIQLKFLPSNHFKIAVTYNNIGGIHLSKCDYKMALSNFENALNIGLKSLPPNHEHIQQYKEHIRLIKEHVAESI